MIRQRGDDSIVDSTVHGRSGAVSRVFHRARIGDAVRFGTTMAETRRWVSCLSSATRPGLAPSFLRIGPHVADADRLDS